MEEKAEGAPIKGSGRKVKGPGTNLRALMEKGSIAADVQEAVDQEDEEKVTDFKEAAKTTRTQNMDPKRFECVLGKTSLKQPSHKRLYLQALPYYIEERAERLRQA